MSVSDVRKQFAGSAPEGENARLQEKYRKLEYFSAVALLMPRSEVPSNGLGDFLAAVSGTHKVVPSSTPSCGEVHSGR